MQTKTSRVFKFCRCLVVFYLVFNCISGFSTAVFAGYLLIFGQERHIPKAKVIVLCFLIVPALFSLLSTILGWSSIKKRNINLLKFFAIVLAVTNILKIAGCLWCFTFLPLINEQVLVHMQDKFSASATDALSENWWSDIQVKLKCCGLHGPTDYYSSKAVPVSCCGTDPDDKSKGSCSFLWQKGCSFALTSELSHDLILLGLVGLGIAFLQIPGVFITWCFAKRISKESLIKCQKETVG